MLRLPPAPAPANIGGRLRAAIESYAGGYADRESGQFIARAGASLNGPQPALHRNHGAAGRKRCPASPGDQSEE